MFTRAQQGVFRPMVTSAWEAHARRHGLDAADKDSKDLWYRGVLKRECNVSSTKALKRTRGFEEAMAAFEADLGEGIYWQMQRYNGDARRIAHEIQKVCRDYDADEKYMRGIARKALGLSKDAPLPELLQLEPGKLLVILRALKIQLVREGVIDHGWER